MKKLNKLSVLLITLFLILSMVGCGAVSNENITQSGKKIIAVSIVPQESFVKAVCGDLVEVVTMIPPGASPENYEPTPMSLENFSKADVYFAVGVPTEANNILPLVSGNTEVVKLHEIVAEKYLDIKIGEERDPHIWLSPKRVVVMIEAIRDKMCEIDAQNAEVYTSNAKAYIDKLKAVDDEIKSVLSAVQNKKMIVFHPAFGYIAKDYEITMYSLEEEGKEATATHLADMIDLAKRENIKVIFYQEEIDSSQSKAFAEEIGGKTVMLSPLAPNYIENMRLMAKTISEAMN